MHFSTAGLIAALLVNLVAGASAVLQDRADGSPILGDTAPPKPFSCYYEADPDGAEGYCPAVAATGWCVCSDSLIYAVETGPSPCGYTTPPAAGPTTLASIDCSTPTAAATPAHNKCSQDECPKFCNLGSDTAKRSIETLDYNRLTKRFYENPNPDAFPYSLLAQTYTRNICPDAPQVNTYIWKKLSTQRFQYASALQGLCDCTTVFIASGNGVFSSHIWEQDDRNNPPRDLQLANYRIKTH